MRGYGGDHAAVSARVGWLERMCNVVLKSALFDQVVYISGSDLRWGASGP